MIFYYSIANSAMIPLQAEKNINKKLKISSGINYKSYQRTWKSVNRTQGNVTMHEPLGDLFIFRSLAFHTFVVDRFTKSNFFSLFSLEEENILTCCSKVHALSYLDLLPYLHRPRNWLQSIAFLNLSVKFLRNDPNGCTSVANK